jgi:hypothetical protein
LLALCLQVPLRVPFERARLVKRLLLLDTALAQFGSLGGGVARLLGTGRLFFCHGLLLLLPLPVSRPRFPSHEADRENDARHHDPEHPRQLDPRTCTSRCRRRRGPGHRSTCCQRNGGTRRGRGWRSTGHLH